MKKYICSECKNNNFSSKQIWLHTLFANKIECIQCGEKLKLKVGNIKSLVNILSVNLLFILSAFAGFYFQSYLAAGLFIVLAIIIDSLIYQSGKLSKYGFK